MRLTRTGTPHERDIYVITLRAKFVQCGRLNGKTSADPPLVLLTICRWISTFFHKVQLFSMSQQAGYSPSFKRPAEIMRLRRKRPRSDAGVFSSPSGQSSTGSPGQSGSPQACVRPFSPGPLFNNQNRSGGGVKRRNPFAHIENTYSPKKKLLIYNDDGNAEARDIQKWTEKEGEEDVSTKKESRGVLPFSARLMKAEKQERQHISSKVGITFISCYTSMCSCVDRAEHLIKVSSYKP